MNCIKRPRHFHSLHNVVAKYLVMGNTVRSQGYKSKSDAIEAIRILGGFYEISF